MTRAKCGVGQAVADNFLLIERDGRDGGPRVSASQAGLIETPFGRKSGSVEASTAEKSSGSICLIGVF